MKQLSQERTMTDSNIPTLSGVGGGGLKTLFERGRRIAEESRAGVCFLDPTGIGEPQFAVWSDATFEEWIEDPSAIFDCSNTVCFPAHVIGDALAERVEERMPDPTLPPN